MHTHPFQAGISMLACSSPHLSAKASTTSQQRETSKSHIFKRTPLKSKSGDTRLELIKERLFASLLLLTAWQTLLREAPHVRSLISIDFPAQKWNVKAHMWYQLSPVPCSNVAICNAPPRQADSYSIPLIVSGLNLHSKQQSRGEGQWIRSSGKSQ